MTHTDLGGWCPTGDTSHIGLPWAGNWARLVGALGPVPAALHSFSILRLSLRSFFAFPSVLHFRHHAFVPLPFPPPPLASVILPHLSSRSSFRSSASLLAPTNNTYVLPSALIPCTKYSKFAFRAQHLSRPVGPGVCAPRISPCTNLRKCPLVNTWWH